jgi:hypothetical protein
LGTAVADAGTSQIDPQSAEATIAECSFFIRFGPRARPDRRFISRIVPRKGLQGHR